MLTVGIYGPKDRILADGTPSFMSHDHNITFMRDGIVIDAIELERYTGKKHDNRLDKYIEDIIDIVWDKKEAIRFILANSFVSKGFSSANGNLCIYEPDDIQLKDIMIKTDGIFIYNNENIDADFYVITHEFAHIATTLPFFENFKENSFLFHLDGGAYKSNHSLWLYKNNKIELLDYGWTSLKKPLNIFNDSKISAWILEMDLSEHLAIPGKLMGFASWGKVEPKLYNWLEENNWFIDFEGEKNEFLTLLQNFTNSIEVKLSLKDKTCQNIAACFQRYFSSSIIEYIKKMKEKYNTKNLYYSGGATLNIITNTIIENELNFEQIMIPPAPSDCGLSLGASAYIEWKEKKHIHPHSPFLNSIGITKNDGDIDINNIVKKIASGDPYYLAYGLAEFGPRALGHRSIIARPDSIPLRIKVSEEIKKREWYRPVAPIILEDIAKEALIDYKQNSNLSKYMLGCWKVKKEWQNKFSGVIHADDTVRAQVISKNSFYYNELYNLLSQLWNKHKIAGIINTSLNIKNFPIIHNIDIDEIYELIKLH